MLETVGAPEGRLALIVAFIVADPELVAGKASVAEKIPDDPVTGPSAPLPGPLGLTANELVAVVGAGVAVAAGVGVPVAPPPGSGTADPPPPPPPQAASVIAMAIPRNAYRE